MDEGGSLAVGLGLAGTLLLVALTSLLRASLAVHRYPEHSAVPSSNPPVSSPLVQPHPLTPELQTVLGILWALLALVAAFLTTLLIFSLGLPGWGAAVAFLVLLAVLLALESTVARLHGKYEEQVTRWGARPLLSLASLALPLIHRLPRQWQSGDIHAEGEPLSHYRVSETANSGSAPAAQGEVQMLRAILNLKQTQVKEILVPRVDIVAVEVGESPLRVVEMALSHGYSRIPVYEETIDRIIGVVYARDLLRYLQTGDFSTVTLREMTHPTMFVPESKRAYELLREFQERRVHLAIVVDEYGGTAGLVTIEDLLEEIVGEIEDEFDREEPKIEWLGDGAAIVDARLSLDDLQYHMDVVVQGEGFDTVGGFVYSQLGRVPSPGDEFDAAGLHVRVVSTTGRRIRKVRLERRQADLVEEEPPSSRSV